MSGVERGRARACAAPSRSGAGRRRRGDRRAACRADCQTASSLAYGCPGVRRAKRGRYGRTPARRRSRFRSPRRDPRRSRQTAGLVRQWRTRSRRGNGKEARPRRWFARVRCRAARRAGCHSSEPLFRSNEGPIPIATPPGLQVRPRNERPALRSRKRHRPPRPGGFGTPLREAPSTHGRSMPSST